MKDHASYRIVAVDHDMISFTDETLHLPELPLPISHDIKTAPPPPLEPIPDLESINIPPIILITNPRDARFATTHLKESSYIRESTHIRILVWSGVGVENISVVIDDGVLWKRGSDDAEYRGVTSSWKSFKDIPDSVNHIPLWEIPWSPRVFDDGKDHTMTVKVFFYIFIIIIIITIIIIILE